MGVSVIIPVRDGGAPFQRCLAALAAAAPPPLEVIVVDDGSRDDSPRWAAAAGARVLTTPRPGSGPAVARNLGARGAAGDVLFFCDADVEIRPETIGRLQAALAADPALAALFGSYDDAPGDPGFLSQYKNLLHHYVHQQAAEQAGTFWSGCGAIRRAVFLEHGGFPESYRFPSIEDIALGVALTAAGRRIRLDKGLQVKHLKRWTLAGLLHSDILARGVPWTRLILQTGRMPNDLNLRTASRLSVGLVYLALLALAAGAVWPPAWLAAGLAAALLAWLNRDVYAFFWRRRGPLFTVGAMGMHALYYGYNGLALALGLLLHLRDRARAA
ncbi:MAG: glycosyltransferase [Anaerolineales bacterium]|nr:glycosyltransferase [Anaerolineales bacterium]